MKLFSTAVLLVSLICLAACSKYAQNSEGGSGLNRTRLYDFRPDEAAVPATERPVGLPDPQELVASLFPTETASCSPVPLAKTSSLPKRRIVIEADLRGSFSAAGQKDRALLVALQPCVADPDTIDFQIVVFPAAGSTTPLARADVPDDRLLQTFDLNRDGQDEFFLAHATTKNGVRDVQAQIYQFDKGKLRTLEDFGDVYENDCHSPLASQGISAAVIDYIPRTATGELPRFVVQLYRAPCPQDGQAPQWQLVSPK